MHSSEFPFVRSKRYRIAPELKDEAAILQYLGITPSELKKIWWCRDRMYSEFALPKANGTTRIIHAPNDRLKHIQRKIADLLQSLYPLRNPVHGFVHGRSVKTNAAAHLGRRYVLNIDLVDFFGSITEGRIVGLLESFVIDPRVCDIIARICCLRSKLPQGSPTSPVLSNMICFRLDRELLRFSKSLRLFYTRYADDITLSSRQPMAAIFKGPTPDPGQIAVDHIAPDLSGLFLRNGFKINPTKIHYSDKNSRRIVTGIKINEILNVDRRYVRNIRAALYSIENLGYEDAQTKYLDQLKGRAPLASHLRGKISFLKFIRGQSDPVVRALAVRFNRCFPNQKIEVTPTLAEIRSRSVWIVEHFENEMAQGSAFFLKGVGLVTAAHCVKDVSEAEVYHPSKHSNKFKVKVHSIENHVDIALLKHSIPETEYFEIEQSYRNVEIGDHVTAIGYPDYALGDGLSVRSGEVNSLPTKSAVKKIEVSQSLAPGMSGGPVVDKDGAVVGIIHRGGPGELKNLAIHIEMLRKWLDQ